MRSKLHHETIYRGKEKIHKLATTPIIVCGAGALGSNLVSHLCRQGFERLSVIDRDRVEEQNIGTQVYSLEDVGAQKAEILKNSIYRETGGKIEAVTKELSDRNVERLLGRFNVIVDSFDNSLSRLTVYQYCLTNNIDCLHIGVNGGYGELRWNEKYLVPSDAGEDVCDYPLARNLIYLVTAVAAEILINYILAGDKENYSITLADLKISRDY